MRAESGAPAARVGATACEPGGSHYAASRYFGPVEYRAVAIPPKTDTDNQESE